MSSNSAEVRDVLSVLAVKIHTCKEDFSAQVCRSLRRLNSLFFTHSCSTVRKRRNIK
jgi:hypothetical protein